MAVDITRPLVSNTVYSLLISNQQIQTTRSDEEAEIDWRIFILKEFAVKESSHNLLLKLLLKKI